MNKEIWNLMALLSNSKYLWDYSDLNSNLNNSKSTCSKSYEHTVRELSHKEIHTKKIGRNDPCPCGSGKKYKYCCGKSKDNLMRESNE